MGVGLTAVSVAVARPSHAGRRSAAAAAISMRAPITAGAKNYRVPRVPLCPVWYTATACQPPACAGASGGVNEIPFGDPATALQRQQQAAAKMRRVPVPTPQANHLILRAAPRLGAHSQPPLLAWAALLKPAAQPCRSQRCAQQPGYGRPPHTILQPYSRVGGPIHPAGAETRPCSPVSNAGYPGLGTAQPLKTRNAGGLGLALQQRQRRGHLGNRMEFGCAVLLVHCQQSGARRLAVQRRQRRRARAHLAQDVWFYSDLAT